MSFDSAKGDTLEFTGATTLLVHGRDLTPYFMVGHRVRTDGFIGPFNNAYFEVSAVAFANNTTTFTFTAGAAQAEKGSVRSVIYDANDVILRSNTSIRAGTGGASTFDSNGANAFAASIAAGQLVVGQKIYVESPLGFQTGSIVIAAQPNAGDQVRISDGLNIVVFQFGGSPTNGVQVVDLGTDAASSTAELAYFVNAARVQGLLNVFAVASGTTLNVTNMTGTGGSLSTVTGAAVSNNFTGGDPTQRGVFKIVSVNDDVLTVSPKPNTNANANTKPITIKGSMLRNPSDPDDIIPADFVYETGYTDINEFFLTDGLKVASMKYDIASGQILKGSFGMNGRRTTRGATTVLGDTTVFTPLATTATDVVNATVNVGAIKVNGLALSTAIQSISFDGENNLRDQMAVSSKYPVGIGAGRMDIKGSVRAYFADGSLWDKFINHTYVSLEWSIQDGEGNHYEWTLPSAVFSTDTVNPSAGNQDVMEDIEFMVRRDPTTDCQFQIDRFSIVTPVTG